ncbi:MAG: 4Fe-4S dicluster domain-containing protein [Chloroflexi bacterium]|nr:4Fe-4S dicluster domain-containing protein [Chloroflexota bacterium]
MLTPVEQVLFVLLSLFALGAAYAGFRDIFLIINRGQGQLYLDRLPARLWQALVIYMGQVTTLKTRRISSLFHLGIVWGFTFYFLVNFGDLLQGFIPNFTFLAGSGLIYDLYRLLADVLSVVVIVGMAYFLLRRFFLPNKTELDYHDNVLLHPKVKADAISRDSLIVGVFILIHVGSRFLGEAALVAQEGHADPMMPFATLVSPLFAGLPTDGLQIARHIFWWLALGGIMVFLPYFPRTKHAHLFMAPLNFLTRPQRTSLGEMEKIDLEGEEAEQFGAHRLEDLTKTAIFDSFACIMCNRCQDVCPAYTTGKELSPSALEINKRYIIKDNMSGLAAGEESTPLMEAAISESAVWACTACGACIDICPVGNEPMLDILDIRRDQVLTQGEVPAELQVAFDGMERQGNPWQINDSRVKWAAGLEIPVPTVEENPDFEVLYWVGCAASYDARSQLTARALVKVLNQAGVNFAILGDLENCTGDSARRAGNEYLYQEMAANNVAVLNEVKPPRIVATCPHCFHNLAKEYHQFGGNYDVVHHTELIEELIEAGRLPDSVRMNRMPNVTFHDPCYLGRHNGILEEPRTILQQISGDVREMPRSGDNSFCCGAGGAQFWKEEEHGDKAVNNERYEEAKATGADVLAVGCPFCMQMFETAAGDIPNGPAVKDLAELIAERLPDTTTTAAAD